MWKNVNTWKIGLWCYHKYVKFISRFYFYSWKMASCRFVVWNWNLEVCFSSAVTLTTPPSSQVPPNLLLDFYRILEEKKKMEGGGERRWHFNKSPPPRRSSGSQMRSPKNLCMVTGSQTASRKWPGHCPTQTPAVASSFLFSSLPLLVRLRWVRSSLMEKLFGKTDT